MPLLPEEINAYKNYYIGARKRFLENNVAPPMLSSYDAYVLRHREPGDFLLAVLKDSLTGAFGAADDNNRRLMFVHASFVYQCLSTGIRRDNVEEWLAETQEPTPEMTHAIESQNRLGELYEP